MNLFETNGDILCTDQAIKLSPEFGNDPTKQVQWRTFLKRSALTEVPDNLNKVVAELWAFFGPLLQKFT